MFWNTIGIVLNNNLKLVDVYTKDKNCVEIESGIKFII